MTNVVFILITKLSRSMFKYLIEGPSWSWSYGSWIINYLCNQCLSCRGEVCSIQHYMIKFVN